MGLIAPGYMPDTYYADRYWSADYWPEYGAPTGDAFVRGNPTFKDPLGSNIGYK